MHKPNIARSMGYDSTAGMINRVEATAFDRSSFAFDAASGQGMAFLASQLEYPNVDLVEPLAALTHPRDITVESGGGYVEFTSAWASEYATTGGNQYGLQGTENTDIAMTQVNIKKGIWPAFNWGHGFRVPYVDLQRLIDSRRLGIPAPYSLQKLLDDGVKLIWGKTLDRVTYLGWEQSEGLINNSNVYSTVAPNGAAGSPLWSKKTPTEIQNDVNAMLLYTQEHSGYDVAGLADRLLVDYPHWSLLNQPMTIGGFNSVLEYIYSNNVAKRQGVDFQILPLPNDWISTQGAGSTSRALAYRNDDKSVQLRVPQPIQKVFTVPSVRASGYETLFMGCIGVVQWYRPQTAIYYDGI